MPRAHSIVYEVVIGTELLEDRDTELVIGRLRAGDPLQFVELYRRYFDRVYTYLRILHRDAEEAQAAVQQVFSRVMTEINTYDRRRGTFRAWLFKIVSEQATADLRRSGRLGGGARRARRTDPAPDAEHARVLDWLTDRGLLLFIEGLPLVHRRVLMLRYMVGLPPAQLAGVLGCSEAEAEDTHAQALGMLRRRLGAVSLVGARQR